MGFCKSDQKSIPVVGFLTRNDCDVLRAKTGGYRRFTHRTIILPTPASGEKVDICMVSTLMMAKICRDPGTPTFVISMADLTPLQVTATNTLNNILAEYHNFSNVFSGEKVSTLTPHRPYDLQINVEEGVKPIHRPIYSLSPLELVALQEFPKEH